MKRNATARVAQRDPWGEPGENKAWRLTHRSSATSVKELVLVATFGYSNWAQLVAVMHGFMPIMQKTVHSVHAVGFLQGSGWTLSHRVYGLGFRVYGLGFRIYGRCFTYTLPVPWYP